MIENNLDFVDLIITNNENWRFTYNPLTKWQSVALVGPKLPCAKKLEAIVGRLTDVKHLNSFLLTWDCGNYYLLQFLCTK